jgi:FtsZ-interacting cell division protein ZipA
MNTATVIAIIVAILAIAFGAFMYVQREKTKRLRSKFGPEYDRAVDRYGNAHRAEDDLARREKRVEKLHLRKLSPGERDRFAEAWRAEQARFVDQPREAVARADRLVQDLMKARGYPVGDFEQRAADISVDHPGVVENYRAAHNIAVRDATGTANTEDLRQSMVHYRALFEDLLERPVHTTDEPAREVTHGEVAK